MTEEERERLAELKTFAWATPQILPLIERKKKLALDLLLGEFRQGKTDLLARVAELNAFHLMEQDLKQKTEEYRTLEEHYASRKQP